METLFQAVDNMQLIDIFHHMSSAYLHNRIRYITHYNKAPDVAIYKLFVNLQ